MQQKAFSDMTSQEREFYRQNEIFYPQNRPTYIGDILAAIDNLSKRLSKIEDMISLLQNPGSKNK